MTQQFFVFLYVVTLTVDLWPWPSKLGEIFVQST